MYIIYIYIAPTRLVPSHAQPRRVDLGLHKIFLQLEPCVQESMILFANNPFVWAPHSAPSSPTLLRNTVFPPGHP